MTRRAARVDANHAAIVAALRAVGADVLDLVAQFENSWESVGALLPRLMRHQTMGEDPAEDEAQGLWQQLKEAALLVEEQVPNCRALFTWYDGPLVTGKR